MRWFCIVCVVLTPVVLGNLPRAEAQDMDSGRSDTPVLDRLREFGRGIFGDPDPKPPRRQPPTADNSTNGGYQAPSNVQSQGFTKNAYQPPTYQTNGGGTTVAVQQPSSSASIITPPAIVARPSPSQAAAPMAADPQFPADPDNSAAAGAANTSRESVAPSSYSPASVSGAAVNGPSGEPRLYERLLSFRDSAFPRPATPAGVANAAPVLSGPAPQQPASGAPMPSASTGASPSALPPPVSPRTDGATDGGSGSASKTWRLDAPADLSVGPSSQTGAPSQSGASPQSIALPQSSASPQSGPIFGEPTLAPSRPKPATVSPPVTQQANPTPKPPAADAPAAGTSAADAPPVAPSSGALFTKQSPVLDVRTIGPRKIMVGRESTYEVVIRNSGQVAADAVTVTVDLPGWADVRASEPSAGAVSPDAGPAGKRLLWKVGRLDGRGQEKLSLRIVPRQSKPLDLAVKWDYAADSSQAMIEVQEPKLQMHLDGPNEVFFGEKQIYRLEITNAGNGDAEGVEISLLPLGSGDNQVSSHRLGTLPAGGKKAVEVELTARQTGSLTIKVDARSEGGFEAHLAQQVLVRRAELKLDVEAPRMQFVGAEVGYKIRVRNTGNAVAKNVKIAAPLLPGMKFVAASKGGRLSQAGSEVAWTLAALSPAGEEDLSMSCLLEQSGPQRLQVASTAEGELVASGEALTQVEAVADLRLDVVDPAGPVALDAEATYEINIRNRGTKSAEEIDVVVYFSQGVEPTTAEGGPYKMAPGQVVFERIPSIAAGKTVPLKVRAKGQSPGNHIFRAEVYCKPLGSRLVSEETTHFYGTTEIAGPAAPAGLSPSASPAPSAHPSSERVADRRSSELPPLLPPAAPPANDKSASPEAKPMPLSGPR